MDDIDEVLEAIQHHFSEHLSEWEFDFVNSLMNQRDDGRHLSAKQREKLFQIFSRFERGEHLRGR